MSTKAPPVFKAPQVVKPLKCVEANKTVSPIKLSRKTSGSIWEQEQYGSFSAPFSALVTSTNSGSVFVNSIIDLMKTAEVSEEKMSQIQTKLLELVNDLTGPLDKVDTFPTAIGTSSASSSTPSAAPYCTVRSCNCLKKCYPATCSCRFKATRIN